MDVVPAAGHDNRATTALVIEFKNVGKTYKSLLGNSVKAVEEFSLVVGEGEILGIAGPNGAGKTTLIAMMLGYLRPTTGTVEISGLAARQYVEQNRIGYLSELATINPTCRVALRHRVSPRDQRPAHADTGLTRPRVGRPDLISAAFALAADAGRGDYDVTLHSSQEVNAPLAGLIGRGALVPSVVAECGVLE